MMKVFITGAAGQIGQRLALGLLKQGHEITCLDLAPAPAGLENVWVQGDLSDLEKLSMLMEGFGAVVHLSAISDPIEWERYPEIIDVNVVGTFNVFEAARRANIKRIVFASSICAIGPISWTKPWTPDYLPMDDDHPRRPDDNYGATKLMGETLARGFHVRFGMEVVCLRFTGVLFPDKPESIERYQKWLSDPHGELVNRLWSYLRSEDALEAIERSLRAPKIGYERVLLAAPDSAVGKESLSNLVAQHFPQRLAQVQSLEKVAGENASLISTQSCFDLFGWRPSRSYRDVPGLAHLAGGDNVRAHA
ncbi:NAD(P)-dependent oxidoreductase [Microvirga sp. VF16]|uniref:NAD-dependent epimerase/dehydratase family protein n=1 Tax=Microvirga sp. VF16 TaxID=2807101 RepID=UPI00193C8814|nr:NAD(P)-dependent oxidoreductase [Microvirga sp. VF16]QRM33165.1 NAD(P)-dependent oxidoreductase [Microvirga sp. VF16]